MLKIILFMPLNYKIKFVHRKKSAFLAIFARSISLQNHENSPAVDNNSAGLHCPARCKGAVHQGRTFLVRSCGSIAASAPKGHRMCFRRQITIILKYQNHIYTDVIMKKLSLTVKTGRCNIRRHSRRFRTHGGSKGCDNGTELRQAF